MALGRSCLLAKTSRMDCFQFVFVEHPVEFISGSINTVSIVGIDNENQALCILIVVSPQRSDLILSSYIPYSEANILVLDSLNVETNSGNGCDNFTQLKLVQDRGLSGSIQTHHKDSHFPLSKHSLPPC